MDIERAGRANVLAGCCAQGIRRIIYVTSLGIGPEESSEWLRERRTVEQNLLDSGLDVTIMRPGHIVGVGGRGFDTMVGNARQRIAFTLGGDHPRMRTIALDDLVYYLMGSLDDPRTYEKRFDVGTDDVLSAPQLIDAIAAVLERPSPLKLQLPVPVMRALAPAIDRIGRLPAGAMRGLIDSLSVDLVGDPHPLREILPRHLLSFAEVVDQALAAEQPRRAPGPKKPRRSPSR